MLHPQNHHRLPDVGFGSTLAVGMFVLSLILTAVYLRHISRQESA